MSYRGRGRGGFHQNNNSRNVSQTFGGQNTQVEVEIFGWDGASPADCIAFIARKCTVKVTNYSIKTENGSLHGFVLSNQEADKLLQWSGVRFAGNPLKMSKVPGAQVPTSMGGGDDTINTLTMFLKSRYNPEIGLLNLSSVQEDPTLSSKGFFGTLSTSSKFFPALMKIAKELKLQVTSADLSNNNLADISTISTLAQSFPNLQNLSLQNNKFTRIKAFETWKRKLNHLRELILIGNPMITTARPQDVANIKTELMKVFPRLVVLNGEIVRNEQALLANLKFAFPQPQPMFFQDSEVQGISTNFITNYVNLWDNNRADLMILYQGESQFSLQVDSTLPQTIDGKAQPDFGYYLPQSRNLTRVSSEKARISKVATGQEQIFKLFSQLPKSHHDLMTKPDNYSMESYRLPQLGAICITLHGSFEETAVPQNQDHVNSQTGAGRNKYAYQKKLKITLGPKSFDRTFIVIPAADSSMIVASDLLCIRPEADADAFKPSKGATPVPTVSPPIIPGAPHIPAQLVPSPSPGPSAADLPPELKNTLSPVQQELMVKVLVETKLNINYALMLCQQSNWDFQQCTVNFKNSAPSLPPDAFAR